MTFKKKQCNAYSKGSKGQCPNTVFLRSQFCWSHYPRKELVFSIIISALLGLFFSILLNKPISQFLVRFETFSYLDNKNPIVESITPDLSKNNYLVENIGSFEIRFKENESGINMEKSEIGIWHEGKKIEKDLSWSSDRVICVLKDKLKYGKYLLGIKLVDQGNNRAEYQNEFYVIENYEFKITANRTQYNKWHNKSMFDSFIDRYQELLKVNFDELYVYKICFANKANTVVLRDVYLSLNMPSVVFSWIETDNFKVNDITSYIFPETNKMLPKDRIFTSERLLNIGEFAPNSYVCFAALVDLSKFESEHLEELRRPKTIKAFGTYISESFGQIKIQQFDKPILVDII